MKLRRFFIWLPMVFAVFAMFASCAYRQPGYTYPSLTSTAPAIATTAIEVTGDNNTEENPETLRVEFEPETGKLSGLVVNGKRIDIVELKDRLAYEFEFINKLEETYFCTPDTKHANTQINDVDVYCGNILFLTEGTDIQIKAPTSAKNQKYMEVRGHVICY